MNHTTYHARINALEREIRELRAERAIHIDRIEQLEAQAATLQAQALRTPSEMIRESPRFVDDESRLYRLFGVGLGLLAVAIVHAVIP